MVNNMFRRNKLKKNNKSIEDKRFTFLEVIVVLSFAFIAINLFRIIIVDKEIYTKNLSVLTSSTVYGDTPPRGRC